MCIRDRSKNLRRGFATVLAQFRNVTNESYYGDRASTIEYPISNTSWAAPRPADEGYQLSLIHILKGRSLSWIWMTKATLKVVPS